MDGIARELPRSRKTRALLAYLAITGRPHRRERLCTMFWDVPDDPRGALRWSLSKLRALADEPGRTRIHADRATVAFDPEHTAIDVVDLRRSVGANLDAMTADQLADAAAAFRGEFLEGLDLDSCPEFQAWCLAERQELRLLRCRILKRLAALLAAQPDRALPHVRTLVDLDPFDEAARALLVRVLAADGRRDEAARQYELSKRALAELAAPVTGELERTWRALRTARRGPPTDGGGVDAIAHEAPGKGGEAEPAGERKQVTILVASVGRTSPDAEDDPEAVMQELDPALEAMKENVRRYDGLVSVTQPDGVTAVFGAPAAHEDHAVRACYAAIAMQAAVRTRIDGSPALRIGLHSGEAVIRATRDGAALRYEAVGPVVSLATRVGALAEPGAILLTQETARRAEGFVHVLPEETQAAGGEPAGGLMMLRGTTGARNRWEVQAARALTPFVGRDAEMAALTGAMRRVQSGKGEVVAVVADPGIGKSRLIHEFVRAAVPSGWSVLETSAASHDTRASYRPVSTLLRAWFGIEQRDQKPVMESKVCAKVEDHHPELRPALPALMSLLDLSIANTDWPTLSAPQRRRRTLDAVKAVFACECRNRPVVLLFEDLHWIDAETQAVLDMLVDSLGALRILLLVTHRPEYRHGWSGRSYFSQLRLLPLAAEAADRLMGSLLGSDKSLDRLKRELVARTEGTPLFAEETVRALAEAGSLSGRPGDHRLARPMTSFEIPSTVQAVIAARIDRLAPASKNLLQIASVIGRDISLSLLRHVAKIPEDSLQEALGDLRAAEFLHEAQLLPDVVYTFKHALTHEVAYGSVLRERRRAIHVELVETMETLNRDRIDEQVEQLAHHAVKGRLWEHAARYLFQATCRAIRCSAHQQALDFIHQGLALIPKLPESAEHMRLELDYQKALGVTMMATKGWSAQEVSDAYVRAQILAESLADERELFVVLRGQGQFHMTRGEAEIARQFGDRCLALSNKVGDPGMRIETHHLFWSNSLFMGDYAGTDHHAEHGIADYDRERDHRLTFVYSGHDPGVCCRCFGGLALWQLGQVDKALVRCEEALALAAELKHPLTTGLAYWGLSYVHMFRGDAARAQAAAEQEIAICEEYLLPLLLSQGRFQLGWALAAQGALDDGIALMRQGLEAISATGAQMGRPYFSALFAEALAKAGRVKDGLTEIDKALAIVDRDQAYFQLPEIRRLKGALLLQLPGYDPDAVTACFRGAMATASQQGSPIGELRAAVSLARLLLHKGRRSEARQLLSDLCGRGLPESAELREARGLLAD